MKTAEKTMPSVPFPTLKTVIKQMCVTFVLRLLVVSFLGTRFLWSCGVADMAVTVQSTCFSSFLPDKDWGREFMMRLV